MLSLRGAVGTAAFVTSHSVTAAFATCRVAWIRRRWEICVTDAMAEQPMAGNSRLQQESNPQTALHLRKILAEFALRLWLCLAVLCAIGCGPSRPPAYPAKGRVVFRNGSSVHVGTVELKSRDHRTQARGLIQPDGTFVLTTYEHEDGAVAGIHDAVVVQMLVAEDLKARTHGLFGIVHPRFASYATSGLTCEIEPSQRNEITLTVEGVGKLADGGNEKNHKK